MWEIVKGIFSGGTMKSIENIATEWIETSKEEAEAKTIMIKALDPNGGMRRELSRKVAKYYGWYLAIMLLLLAIEFICVMLGVEINMEQLALTTEKMAGLFAPITGLFGLIVSASFGVNYANVKSTGSK